MVKSQCLSRVFNDLRSCPTIERGAVFVRSAVLLAGVYWLSAEIWVAAVCVRSGARRSARVCCDVVLGEALSMKVLSEVDGVYCLVV